MAENKEITTKNKESAIKRVSKSIVDSVQDRVSAMTKQGEINFPPNYSVSNALRSAWLIIQETKDMNQRPALDVCTHESIANALLNTVIQGLNPAKKQIYYIVYGDKLQAQRSYFGTIAATKRVPGVVDIISDVFWKGDKIDLVKANGSWSLLSHESSIDNIGESIDDIRGAYCTILFEGGGSYTEVMNQKQIKTSWNKSRSKAQTVHKEFPDQMAKRTVINRACKNFMNTSDDSDMLIEAFNATGERYEESAAVPTTARDSRLKELNSEISAAQVQPGEQMLIEEGA